MGVHGRTRRGPAHHTAYGAPEQGGAGQPHHTLREAALYLYQVGAGEFVLLACKVKLCRRSVLT